jgi:hypothetical protein
MSDKEPQQWMLETAAEILVGKGWCPICRWTLADSAEKGCVIGNCSYRPGDHRQEELRDLRVSRARWNEVAEIIAAHCPEKELGHGTEQTPQRFTRANRMALRCPHCNKDRANSADAGGNSLCFHCGSCGFVECEWSSPAHELAVAPPDATPLKSGKYPIARPSPDLLHTIRYLLLSWSVFYTKLPDGDYDGLGEMRTAVENLKGFEAEALPDKCPTCQSPKKHEHWCKDEFLSCGPHRVTGKLCEICTDSWHSSVATQKESK